ncbi:SET domain-containing protein [Cucurbitaria berberidis CBS 394.84]|uniref:SET domain-containing protein n=1 Tax=Cucurbitaria berberidis CBS 394.84 TaxID=1168544 RepID=A0A9P4LCT7_9PLEO|nr:SET domain-containing protein [Cucurbitaria berberidis CBS 394.84]KAF1850355.1 SET domain-containing protein [Cucurbitaria berberidis CBS 394.84]
MKTAVGLTLLSRALALTNEKLEVVGQKPLLHACPSDSILQKGECQDATFGSSHDIISDVAFRSNISQFQQTLEESRKKASQVKDFPWTFWPECFSNENTTDPYCVFTDQSFASGRGIFIITTKDLAYDMLEHDAWRRPETLSRVNKYDSPPFVTHEFPGKGRGLVANKTLHRGDQIFASTPILITDSGAYDLSEAERLALLYRGVDTLPPASQKVFWELLGHFNDDPVDDRINTNNFDVSIDEEAQAAVFPEIAMLNHDCRPNAAYAFDERTMTHYVHAVRDIMPGEEITITYIDNEMERARRVKKLKRNWGFDCSCSTCTAHPSLVSESDTRLGEIAALSTILDDWTIDSEATPEAAELLISLYEQERLHANLATAYKHAAEAYSSFGKKWEAMRYARLSAEMSMLDKGFGDSDVKEMREMSLRPELSWSWKKRVGMGGKSCGCGHGH